jgi:ferritin-like metal-binding protein YciE
MRRAPELAGDPELAAAFEHHLVETERHERLVRSRLDDHDAEPSTVKDIAGKAGGLGMLMFAQFNPDTPGKLVNHAFSYEHMEVAAYELLARVAERAGDVGTVVVAFAFEHLEIAAYEQLRRVADRTGDEQTASLSARLADEERRAATGIASLWDAAVDAALIDQGITR